jgi:hypothetical protein
MASSYSVFKAKFKKTIIDAVYQEIISRTALYHHWLGKENSWQDFLSPFIGANPVADAPGQPSDNLRYDLHVRRDILTTKLIKPSDVSYVARRIDWVENTVYDMYDDAYDTSTGYGFEPAYSGATRLEDANFYVMTSEYNVYKCLWNENNSQSRYMPTGTGYERFTTADGYIWKFMYAIPVSLRNKFLTDEWMPVTTSLTKRYFNPGQIENIAILNGGSGYNPATTTVEIDGNGFQEDNPAILSEIQIIDGGSGYTSNATINIHPPFTSSILWEANKVVQIGQYIKYTDPSTTDENYYLVISGTTLGTSAPIHKLDSNDNPITYINGTCQLKYAGTTVRAQGNVIGGVIDSISITEQGYGYYSEPSCSAEPPITKDANWSPSTSFTLGDIIFYSGIYYQITTTGITSATPPSHTTGSAVNGTATLNVIAKDAELLCVMAATKAEIELIISAGTDSVENIVVTNAGIKYAEVPTVTLSAPVTSGGSAATAEAIIDNGEIVAFNIVSQGNGYLVAPSVTISNPVITFNGNNSVNASNDSINYDGHLLETGDEVEYNDGGGTQISGLVSGSTYYIIRVDENNIRLAASESDALSNTQIDIDIGIGDAHTLELTSSNAAATAILGLGGEIIGYTIKNSGAGYTYADIIINDPSGGSGADLRADFDVGDVDTLQANVELLANPGTIEVIKLVDVGANYSTANVTILGDGSGAVASPIISNGQIVGINMLNVGTAYTWTDVIIEGDGTGAIARAIMSPIAGHGADALDELNASALMLYSTVAKDLNQGIEIDNDYRKLGLVRNLKQFGSNRRFTDDTGSGCVLIEGNFEKLKLEKDMLLYNVELSGPNYKKYRIVDYTDTQILLSVFNNFTINIGDRLVTDPGNIGRNPTNPIPSHTFTVTSVSERSIDQFSGDWLFFSVREPYNVTVDQVATLKTVISL